MIRFKQSLLVILFFVLATFFVDAEQKIATDAYGIFQQSCLICHGAVVAYKETLLMEHAALIAGGTVVPGNPSASLLANYPNPFNPETWTPYRLAEAAEVRLMIYDAQGAVVRRFDLGHQQAGDYTDRTRTAYSGSACWRGYTYRSHSGSGGSA